MLEFENNMKRLVLHMNDSYIMLNFLLRAKQYFCSLPYFYTL